MGVEAAEIRLNDVLADVIVADAPAHYDRRSKRTRAEADQRLDQILAFREIRQRSPRRGRERSLQLGDRAGLFFNA